MTTNAISFTGIDHHSLIISDGKASKFFYQQILGLELDSARPKLSVEGFWFKVGPGRHAIHCLILPNPDPTDNRPEHGGRDRHVALRITHLQPLIERLEQHNITYTKSFSGRQAIFFRDPDSNAIEVIEEDQQ